MTQYADYGDLAAANTWVESPGYSSVTEVRDRFICASGTFTGTLSIQAKFKDETNWRDIGEPTQTAPFSLVRKLPTTMDVRCGFAAGNYTSGTASVAIA